ncbi:hypothetical protein V1478_016777, partial [Vespula squamosa]
CSCYSSSNGSSRLRMVSALIHRNVTAMRVPTWHRHGSCSNSHVCRPMFDGFDRIESLPRDVTFVSIACYYECNSNANGGYRHVLICSSQVHKRLDEEKRGINNKFDTLQWNTIIRLPFKRLITLFRPFGRTTSTTCSSKTGLTTSLKKKKEKKRITERRHEIWIEQKLRDELNFSRCIFLWDKSSRKFENRGYLLIRDSCQEEE